MNKPAQMIFINIPVTDLQKSKTFYEAIGFTCNRQFSDETAACMVVSETISVMLLTHPKWKQFTNKLIPDAKKSAQVMLCLSSESRESVNSTLDAVKRAGGKTDPSPAQDHGFMYGRSFEDLDGHIWETMWMDPSAMSK